MHFRSIQSVHAPPYSPSVVFVGRPTAVPFKANYRFNHTPITPSGSSFDSLMQSSVSPGDPSPVSPLCSGCPHRPLRSNRISGALSPAKSATSAIRFLLWGTPQNCASCTRQATDHFPISSYKHPAFVHPPLSDKGRSGTSFSDILTISSRTVLKSSPLLLLKAPGTFSQTIYLGRIRKPVRPFCLSRSLISFTMRICSMNSPDRSPDSPARFPATLRS